MPKYSSLFLGLMLLLSTSAFSQSVSSSKSISASSLGAANLRVDGILDEEFWEFAEFTSDFIQREPVEGAPPSYRTEVAFMFDHEAL